MLQRDKACKVEWCRTEANAKNLCKNHHTQYNAHDLSYDLYLEAVDTSGGECANPGCEKKNKLAMDHDHAICEGKKACVDCFRGMLCMSCNSALGMLEDDEDRIRGLWYYLNNMI